MVEALKWGLAALSIPVVVVLVRHVRRSARDLDERIEQYHAEQEAAQKQPGPKNPYQDLAELFGDGSSASNPQPSTDADQAEGPAK